MSDPEDVSVPVADLRGGLDGRQNVGLFQPNEQLLCAPENDHQFVNLHYDIGELNHEHYVRRDRDLVRCTQPAEDLDAIRAACVRTI